MPCDAFCEQVERPSKPTSNGKVLAQDLAPDAMQELMQLRERVCPMTLTISDKLRSHQIFFQAGALAELADTTDTII